MAGIKHNSDACLSTFHWATRPTATASEKAMQVITSHIHSAPIMEDELDGQTLASLQDTTVLGRQRGEMTIVSSGSANTTGKIVTADIAACGQSVMQIVDVLFVTTPEVDALSPASPPRARGASAPADTAEAPAPAPAQARASGSASGSRRNAGSGASTPPPAPAPSAGSEAAAAAVSAPAPAPAAGTSSRDAAGSSTQQQGQSAASDAPAPGAGGDSAAPAGLQVPVAVVVAGALCVAQLL